MAGKPQHRVCSLVDCDSPHVAKGYCRVHYQRVKRYGDPYKSPIKGRPSALPLRFAVDGLKTCAYRNCVQSNPQPVSNFHSCRSEKDGLRKYCKICRKVTDAKNKEHVRIWAQSYYVENQERIKKRALNSYHQNPAARRERIRIWQYQNHDRVLGYGVLRRSSQAYRDYELAYAPRRRDLNRKYYAIRRMLIRQHCVEAENFSLDQVAERDNFICGLCGLEVDFNVQWPNVLSKSLDHVLPVSAGGKHRLDNVQLAHLLCNMKKGSKVLFVLSELDKQEMADLIQCRTVVSVSL